MGIAQTSVFIGVFAENGVQKVTTMFEPKNPVKDWGAIVPRRFGWDGRLWWECGSTTRRTAGAQKLSRA